MSIKDRILKRRGKICIRTRTLGGCGSRRELVLSYDEHTAQQPVFAGIDRTGNFCILFYYFTGITPNIALSYLIIDMIVIFAKRHFAIRRIREDQAYARLGDRTEVLLQMARELSEKTR